MVEKLGKCKKEVLMKVYMFPSGDKNQTEQSREQQNTYCYWPLLLQAFLKIGMQMSESLNFAIVGRLKLLIFCRSKIIFVSSDPS